jgi:hypothetical protein
MELLEVLITLPLHVTTLRVLLRELFLYQQLLILLQENETFTMELLRLLEQSMIMMRSTVATILLLRLPKEVLLCLNSA